MGGHFALLLYGKGSDFFGSVLLMYQDTKGTKECLRIKADTHTHRERPHSLTENVVCPALGLTQL